MHGVQTALNEGIAAFYDESSGLWERIWGEHMHHGYYPKDGLKKSNQEAQVDMIEEVLRWAGVTEAKKVREKTSHSWLRRFASHDWMGRGSQARAILRRPAI
jgi:hypothetical protein